MQASDWIIRWTHLLRPRSRVLDIACGSGRHVRWFADQGHTVIGVDRDIRQCTTQGPSIRLLQADGRMAKLKVDAVDGKLLSIKRKERD